jgi:hypothetical protein
VFNDRHFLFAAAVVELQDKRHATNYDPLIHIRRADAELIIRTARSAPSWFDTGERGPTRSVSEPAPVCAEIARGSSQWWLQRPDADILPG